MPTEKLYWRDPFEMAFAHVPVRLGRFGDKPSLVLDGTIFYPEAGGQLADQGHLEVEGRSFAVTDVQIDDEGLIHHLVEGASELPAGFEGIASGRIDAARRRDFMAQHTAQHMLSRALLDEARGETVSSRLGATTCTIDLSRPSIPEADIARAEALVNAVVRDDRTVRAFFPTAEELEALPLRRAPKVATGVRVIDVDGFDLSPCGGTHCTRTGQIGAVRVVGVEKYKGMTRITFHAADRALADAREKERVLQGLAADFTCGPLDVPAAVAKLRGELKARLDALSQARGELVAYVAAEALKASPPASDGTTRILVVRPADDIATLRTLAGALTRRPDVVAVCASRESEGGDYSVVVQRGETARFDCGAWLKAAAAATGGRGGGRPERAEGRLPATSDLSALTAGVPGGGAP